MSGRHSGGHRRGDASGSFKRASKIMRLTYKPSSQPKGHVKAISVCLYRSDRFSVEKHMEGFAKFVKMGQQGYDILIFHEPGMPVPTGATVRAFEVTSNENGYHCHLWRYMGGLEGYAWTWFRGTDTARIPRRETNLEAGAEVLGSNVIAWQSPGFACTGRMAAKSDAARELIQFLREESKWPDGWHCDERLLSNWMLRGKQRVLLAMDAPLLSATPQPSWVMERLKRGHHTVIVKDRDDRV
jgi:hypothetical protein